MIFKNGINLLNQNIDQGIYDQKSFRALVYISVACFLYGISAGINLTSFSMFLSGFNLQANQISQILSLEIIGNITIAPFMILVARAIGDERFAIYCLIFRNMFLLIFGMGTDYIGWTVGLFGFGMFGFALHTSIFQWINLAAKNTHRATYLSASAVLFGLGIAIGPILLSIIDIGPTPSAFFISVGISSLMLIPLSIVDLVNARSTKIKVIPVQKILNFSSVPIISAISGQYIFLSIIEFLPLYALEFDMMQSEVYMLVGYFCLSGLVLGIPIGIMIDRYDRLKALICFAFGVLIFTRIIPYTINDKILVFLVFSPLCACINGILIISLAIIGDKFKGDDFIAANITINALSMIGGYVGIVSTGNAIDKLGADGMIYSISSIIAVYIVLLLCELIFRKT
ncbi:MAG: MFS transporter [Rickettsiaceae bacterium]|nr:MFS transporter [Rickettsiaceae bacterium]